MAISLSLRKVFLYIFASIGLVLSIIGLVQLLNLGLKTYVFTKADYPCDYMYASVAKDPNGQEPSPEELKRQEQNCIDQRTSQKQREASTAIAMLIVGVPLYFYHWNTIRRDNEI